MTRVFEKSAFVDSVRFDKKRSQLTAYWYSKKRIMRLISTIFITRVLCKASTAQYGQSKYQVLATESKT